MTDVVEMPTARADSEVPFVAALDATMKTSAPGPEWLSALRREARAWFKAHGLPHPKQEAWRFTSLRPIARLSPVPVRSTPELAGAAPAGVSVRHLDSAGPELEAYLGKLGSTNHAFAALNTALFEDALIVEVAPGTIIEEPLELAHVARGGAHPMLSTPRLLVIAGEGSQLRLVERYRSEGGTSLTTGVTELFVADNAAVEHVRVLEGALQAFDISLVAVRQARNSRYTSRVATFGGALSRLDLRVLMDGQGAECTLDGLYLAGDDEHVDHQTFIDHAHAHCTSHEKYKGVVSGSGRAVFDGGITVRRGAQQTDAHQENRNLVLSDRATVNTKPSLVIDADDVKCSHGATVGQLDPAALFYLRARGIGEPEARALLAFAFAREMTERVPLPAVRRELVEAVLARMAEGQQLARELEP